MFALSAAVRVYLTREPADMRKSFDALNASHPTSRTNAAHASQMARQASHTTCDASVLLLRRVFG